MKKATLPSLYILISFLLFSCGESKTKEIVSSSKDTQNQVKVSGNRSTSFDPFQTSIIINGFGQSDTLITEIYANDLTTETVSFNWSDNTNCILTFKQQDDSKRDMVIEFAENGNSLREGK